MNNNDDALKLKRWCFLYEDRTTGEKVKVRGWTNDFGTIFADRSLLVDRKLRFLGLSTCNVTGYEIAKTVPEFSYVTG